MARAVEVAALRAIEDAYQAWTVISEQVHREVGEAAQRRAGAPVDSLRADFNAQLAVTRSVVAFAHTCPATGPDVDDLPGAAFIQALYQVVQSQPDLQQALAELTRQWESWLSEVKKWTPASDNPPPARPTSPAHSRVLDAVDDWWGFGADRLHEQLVGSLKAQGHHVVESITTGDDGEVIQSAHVVFDPAPTTEAHGHSKRGPLRRLQALLGVRSRR